MVTFWVRLVTGPGSTSILIEFCRGERDRDLDQLCCRPGPGWLVIDGYRLCG
jgi:hypothetical protein